MRFFESKICNNKPMDYKPRKIKDAFKGRCVEYKSEQDKKSPFREYLDTSI